MANKTDLVVRLRAEQAQLRKDLNAARGEMKRFQSSTTKFATAIQSQLATAFGGYAVVQGLRQAVNTIADFEYQMDKVAAVSGASADEVKKLTNNARELGAKSKFTATEIGKLQEELARLGFSTDQIVNMTDAARQLATVADAELGESAKVVGQILNAFNLEATESVRVANVMAESFSKSALNLEEFQVAMSYAATAGKSAGFSLEQVTSMLAMLVDRGIQGSKAGTALRDIFSDLSIKGMTLDEALSEINESTDKNKTAFDLFGKVSMNAAVILAETQEETEKLNKTFSDTNEELSKMTDIMEDNLLTDFAKFKSALNELTLGEGSKFSGFLRWTTQLLTDFVSAAAMERWTPQAWHNLQDELEKTTTAYKKAQKEQKELISGMFGVADPFSGVFQFGNNKDYSTTTPKKKIQRTGVSGALSLAAESDIPEYVEMLSDSEFMDLVSGDNSVFNEIAFGVGEGHELLEEAIRGYEEKIAEFEPSILNPLKEVAAVMMDIGDLFSGAVMAIVEGFQIGKLEGAFHAFKVFLGNAMVQLGEGLIAINTGKLALGGAVPPPAGIAIGAALIAAGSVLASHGQKNLSRLASQGGLSGGGYGGDSGTQLLGQSVSVNGELRVSGEDLVYVFNQYNRNSGRIGG